MTGFARQPPNQLLSLYQSWMRIFALRFHPELEQLWQLENVTRGEQEQPLDRCTAQLAKLTNHLRRDARELLLMPDFMVFVQQKLKRYPPRQPWEPEATRLSVPSEPKKWLLLNAHDPLQLEYFQLLTEPGMDDDRECFVAYSYELTVTLGQLEVNLEEIEIGKLYVESLRFVRCPFKEQQEAIPQGCGHRCPIAQQLATDSIPPRGLSLRLAEEISCLVCYAALAFSLEEGIEAFQAEAGVELESQFDPETF